MAEDAGPPADKAELREQIEAMLKKINPDYNILFAQPIEMRFNEMLEGTKAELSVKIFGTDYDVLEKLAEQIKGILEKTPGAAQVEFETEGRTPQLLIEAKHDVLQRYSLSAAEVNKAISAALAGKVVGTIEGEKRHDIVVRMPEELRADDEKIHKLPLRVGDHGLIQLGQVGRVQDGQSRRTDPARRRPAPRRAHGEPRRTRCRRFRARSRTTHQGTGEDAGRLHGRVWRAVQEPTGSPRTPGDRCPRGAGA